MTYLKCCLVKENNKERWGKGERQINLEINNIRGKKEEEKMKDK